MHNSAQQGNDLNVPDVTKRAEINNSYWSVDNSHANE